VGIDSYVGAGLRLRPVARPQLRTPLVAITGEDTSQLNDLRRIGLYCTWPRQPVWECCGTMPVELSARFERERAPVAQWIRAADFGLSRPMRCGTERESGSEASSYPLSSIPENPHV